MKRYSGNLDIFERLSFRQIHKLVCTAIEESNQDLVKLRWIITGERLGMSWEEFRESLKNSNESKNEKSAEEILDELGEKMAAIGW